MALPLRVRPAVAASVSILLGIAALGVVALVVAWEASASAHTSRRSGGN